MYHFICFYLYEFSKAFITVLKYHSDNPLSIYAKAEKTIIDGVVYFYIEKDAEKQVAIAKERSVLIGQMLQEKNKGANTQQPTRKEKTEYHCDTLEQ